MKSQCPATKMFNGFKAKFSKALSVLEEKHKGQCAITQFKGKMRDKIFKRLEKDNEFREAIGRGIVKDLSILFVDIRGFSARTATMPPEQIVRLLDLFIPEMLSIIVERHKGTVDKLLGDGIMALYGHPYSTGEEIIQAIHSAVDMQQVTAAMAEALSVNGYEPIEIGVGINCGEVLICEVGDERYREATVIGAPVNLAAKMEDVAEAHEIAFPRNIMPVIEKLKPDMTGYFEDKGRVHDVDVITLDWVKYIEHGQKTVMEWEIK